VTDVYSYLASRVGDWGLAEGQATGDQDSGDQDAALVITDLTAASAVAVTDTIAVDDISRPPCAIWSAIAEIAQMLGSSVSSTYSLLARARNELRSHLTGDLTLLITTTR
jgi:hypothetical protein